MRLSASQLRVGPRRFAALLLALVASYLLVVHVFISSADPPNHPRDLLSLRDDNSNVNTNSNTNNNNNNEVNVVTHPDPAPRRAKPDVDVLAAPFDDFDEALANGDGEAAAERPISRVAPVNRNKQLEKVQGQGQFIPPSPRRTDKLPAERNDTAEMERDDRLNWEFGDENVLAARQLMMPVNASSVTTVRSPPPLGTTSTSETLPLCPDLPDIKELEGPMQQAVLLIQNIKETEVLRHHTYLKPGGHWKPSHCVARHKVAVIVPFRDRQSHLSRLLDFLVPLLKRQMLDFRFIVTEQYGNDLFNKGRIMNAAFEVAQRLGVNCVIFHDVDMFPQNDRNPYGCPDSPRHIGAFVSNLGYQLWYDYIVGGALAIRMEHYIAVNGYSNMYWAWGGEDDDMGKRIFALNFTIERPHPIEGRFTMLKHVKRKRTAPKLIYKLLDSAGTRWPYDGLNETGLWKIVKITRRPLYYHMYVDVGQPPEAWRIDGDLPETTVAAKAAAPAAAPIV